MSNSSAKSGLLIAMFLFCTITTAIAQDIIIKNDKTEIKSKVTELTETTIKYKKWDNLDGPIYNIAAKEVFMIIYANGQRDIITTIEPHVEPALAGSESYGTSSAYTKTPKNIIEEEKSENVIRLGTNTGFNLVDLEYDWRYKLGLKKDFSLGFGGNITYGELLGLYYYASAAQRIWLKNGNELPLKLWFSCGIANSYDWATEEAVGTGAFFLYEFGTDIPLNKSGDWGISLYTPKFNSLFLGIFVHW